MKKRRGKRASNNDHHHHHHGHSHNGVECNSQHRHDDADYDVKEEERKARRDKLLSEEIGCFIFLINKDEEDTSTQLPKWLIETRYKKNWIIFYSLTINKKLLWNDVNDDHRPANLKRVLSLSHNTKNTVGIPADQSKKHTNAIPTSKHKDELLVRSDLINGFSKIFSDQSTGKLDRIHNIIIILDSSENIVPILRTFFIDSLPSIQRMLLHSISYIFNQNHYDDDNTDNSTGLLRKNLKYFNHNIALCNSIFVLTNEDNFKKSKVEKELQQLVVFNDRCACKYICTKHLVNKTKENKKLKARSDFELFAYSRWVAAQVSQSMYYFKYGIDGNNNESDNTNKKYKALEPIDFLPIQCCQSRRITILNSLDLTKFTTWLDALFEKNDVLRVKGHIAFQGSGDKFIVQGVSGFWGCEPSQKFKNERRKCRLLFVATQFEMSEVDMKKSLETCIAPMGYIEQFYWFYESETYLACLFMAFITFLWFLILLLGIDQGYINEDNLDLSKWWT
jgi:G3E family GTPase